MTDSRRNLRLYDGDGDQTLADAPFAHRLIVVPDGHVESRHSASGPKLRLMWGQLLLDDLLADRYRTLVCAVNAQDNSRGVIAELASRLPTSQWNEGAITAHAKRFSFDDDTVKVIKFDMDAVEVLGLLRPANRSSLNLDDLWQGFRIVTEMIARRTTRWPSAAVSFLGARSNRLVGPDGDEPSLETVLRVIHDAGYRGDIYPSPQYWSAAPTPVFARFPYPDHVGRAREGGF